MKVIDYAHYKSVPTGRAILGQLIDAIVNFCILIAFLTICAAVLSLL